MRRLFGFTLAILSVALLPLSANQSFAAPEYDTYIVVLKSDKDKAEKESEFRIANLKIKDTYTNVFSGFLIDLPTQAVEKLKKDPKVLFVELDAEVTTFETQLGATWGLDRIDQRYLPLSTSFNYSTTGAGVRVYIVDTGVRATHTEFNGRVSDGFSAISDGNGTNDCNGHGTHVTGTVAGSTYGVAKTATIVPVRVLNCQGSGTTSGVISGLDWVVANFTAAPGPSVVNMSLGGAASTALDTAVNSVINKGVTVVVAAGNSNANVCNYSPARVAAAVTVGATNSADTRAPYSNFGTCLDLFAPGSSITSTWITSTTATNTISGTSMASPHVAGVAAVFLSRNPTLTPAGVSNALASQATLNKVGLAGKGSPNRLLFSNPVG